MGEMSENGEDLFFVYCDIFESINTYLFSSLGVSLGDIVNDIAIIDEIEERINIDAPKDIANFLKEITEVIGEIREIYHISSKKKKIGEKELRKMREEVRDCIRKMERYIGKIEYLIELRKRGERMGLRAIVRELQRIKKIIKEFNDSLDAINSIEWEAGLSKATIAIKPKDGRKFHLAQTKLFDLAIAIPLNVLVSIEKEKVILATNESFLFDFFPIPSMSHVIAKSISISKDGIEMKGLQEGNEICIEVKRKGENIHIDFFKDNEKASWTYPLS